MKRFVFPLAALAVVTACQVEDIKDSQDPTAETFSIKADLPSSKTTLTVDGNAYKVQWNEDDALSVVAKYADGSYAGYEFTKTGDNVFSCENVQNPSEMTELNILYPYDDYLNSISDFGTFNGYTYIGSRSDASQVQDGVSSTGHVNAPLCGHMVLTEGTTVKMIHVTTLLEVILKNESGIDISVSNISVSNSEKKNLVGTFYVNPQTGGLSEGNYVAPNISLNVNNGIIAAGETGKFYIVSAPFALAANSTLDFTLTVNGKEDVITKTVSEATEFVAGTVNHIYLTVQNATEEEPIVPMSVPGSVSFSTGSVNPDYVTVSQGDERYGNGSLKLEDSNENIVVFVDAAVGSIDITAQYNGATTSTLDILGSVDGVEYDLIEIIGSENGIGTSQSSCSTSAVINPDFRYFKFNMNKNGGNFGIFEIKFNEELTEPYVTTETKSLEFTYEDAKTGSISYSILNASHSDVSVSCDDALSGWFTASKSSDGVISYTVEANEGDARTGNMTISVAGGNSLVIPVSQTAKPAEGTVTDVLTADLFGLTGSYADFADKSATSSAVYAGNAMKGSGGIQLRSNNNNSGIITTVSGGKAKTVSVVWISSTTEGRELNIYGSATPYGAVGDLYAGTSEPIATIVKGEGNPTSVNLEGDYPYIAFRSESGAMYLEQIQIVWDVTE